MSRKEKLGWDCDPINPDGSRTCRRILQDGKTKEKLVVGSDITVGTDPETCEPIFSGDAQTIMDGDDEAIKDLSDKVTSKCKKEKGL